MWLSESLLTFLHWWKLLERLTDVSYFTPLSRFRVTSCKLDDDWILRRCDVTNCSRNWSRKQKQPSTVKLCQSVKCPVKATTTQNIRLDFQMNLSENQFNQVSAALKVRLQFSSLMGAKMLVDTLWCFVSFVCFWLF